MVRRVLTVVALGIFLSAQQAAASGRQAVIAAGRPRIAGHVLSALPRARPVRVSIDAVSADQPLSLTVVLNRDDPAGFDRFLADVYNPLSPRFRHFLSPSEISDRFGPSHADYDLVAGYLQDSGFTVTDTSPNRMTMVVVGTRGLAETAFHLNLGDYELSGRRFFANDADPELPAIVAPRVQAIVGLNSLAKPASLNQGGPCAKDPVGCFLQQFAAAFAAYEEEGCLTKMLFIIDALLAIWLITFIAGVVLPVFLASISHVIAELVAAFLFECIIVPQVHGHPPHLIEPGTAPPRSAGPNATGQTVGLLEFDTFHSADVSDFLAFNGFPATMLSQVSEVEVNGGASLGAGETEVLLDIDAILTLAPGAHVVVYDAPFSGGSGFQALFNRMINDHVNVISNSWSYCEDQTTPADAQSLDSILATAAASGIGVYNAAGDSGSSCLDGAPNTIGVPADSPHATAVGGASITLDDSFSFAGASWWDGSASTPPTGQGGFGVSKFFARPSYQDGLTSATGRSVPDVVANSNPATGLAICQADAGGCPTGSFNGGTSLAAPIWAAYAALLNDSFGQNLGLLNHGMYVLGAGAHAFHGPAEMGSDFAHVGLGLPNLSFLTLGIAGLDPGPGDAANSDASAVPNPIPADGTTPGRVVVQLLDANGALVGGKTVSLIANGGSSASISPPSAVTSIADGTAKFTITDGTVEDVTFTAHDDTDGVAITKTVLVHFVAPAATAGNVVASPTIVAADGSSASTITVTLHDTNDNGAAGKTVTLAQGAGRSLISGPTPATTDSNGQVVFTATDTFTESVTYTATDVTDGNLAVPDTGTSTVSFTSGSGSSCPVAQEVPQPGWSVTSPETGFMLASNCVGVSGTAWDHDGNLWALNYPNGRLYKFPPAGGTASAGTLVGTLPDVTPPTGLTSCPHGLAFSKDGQHLYVARQFCGFGGDVVEVSMADASIVKNLTAADAIHCATGIATDPISGDLFVASPCQSGDNLWRIANPESSTPTLSVYAHPGLAIGLNFTPDGTIWTEGYPGNKLVKISGTNSGSPGAVTVLGTNAPPFAGGVLPVFNAAHPGNPSFLLVTNGATSGNSGSVQKVDLTQNPPVLTTVATGGTGEIFVNGGPDGCAYVSNGDRIDRITAADGTCGFATSRSAATLSLSPGAANPAQGSTQTMTAQFSDVSVPANTPVFFQIAGANTMVRMGKTDANRSASIQYTGTFPGTDAVAASATVGTTSYASNVATITWGAGRHVSFLSLNGCPTSDTAGSPVTLSASLFDISTVPAAPISQAPIHFALGAQSCDAITGADGVAVCSITPPSGGTFTLTATYAGSAPGAPPRGEIPALLFDRASASTSFLVIGPQPVEGSPIPTLDPKALVLLGMLLAGAGMLAAKKMR